MTKKWRSVTNILGLLLHVKIITSHYILQVFIILKILYHLLIDTFKLLCYYKDSYNMSSYKFLRQYLLD